MKKTQLSGRLCILVNSLAGGGGERVALNLFEEYQLQGLDVVLVCLEKNDVHSTAETGVYYLSEQTGHGEGRLTKLVSLVGFAFKLKSFIQEQNIAFVQSHLYRANYVNVLARKLGAGHRVQIANHGIAERYLGEGLLGRVNLFLIRRLYPVADQIICPSAGMRTNLIQIAGDGFDARVIGNPFPVDDILSRSRERVAASEFVFQDDRRYLISVGRLEKVKHPEQIIEALSALEKGYPDLELLLLGSGTERENLLALASRLGLTGKVHLLGQVANPFKYISRADVFMAASEFEGFSNVIVEAMISGTAVVSTDCPSGPREILAPSTDLNNHLQAGEIEEAEYGMLVPVGDVPSLVAAVDSLLQDQKKCRRYGENGIIRAENFARSIIAEKYLDGLLL